MYKVIETSSTSITYQNSDPNCAIEDLCNDFQNAPLLQRKLSILLCQNCTTIWLLFSIHLIIIKTIAQKIKVNDKNIWKKYQSLPTHLLSAAAILRSSIISLEIKFCTPSDGSTTSFKCLMFSFERDCIRLAPLTIVFATSKAKIEILFPFVVTPEVKPLLRFKLVMLLPSVSKTSTAFPSPAVPALPKSELTSETYKTRTFYAYSNNIYHIITIFFLWEWFFLLNEEPNYRINCRNHHLTFKQPWKIKKPILSTYS